ncbi:MAG: DegT/DnrJ/EryC1/StrS family aminotransferase [Myxococcales bacterium FL481]|nr:MAG: DegT/DnrJ/EryC1/StrS family aminotransferase [Myxococcales bacterium FL481]
MHVRYSYLPQQFAKIDDLLTELGQLARSGDFTLGAPVAQFEKRFAELIGTRHAIGVGSGTDALKLPLAALGIGPGDEVITAANTFIATAGAIHEVGARPVFVDCDDTFCMDVAQVQGAITDKTKAIMPVHFTGYMTEMEPLMQIARRADLPVIEDACQAILADINGQRAGTFGRAAGFSLHPLKNLNVWGDAGVIVTDDDELDRKLRLLRNHGMTNRDEIACFGYNSRLDSVHAVVGNWLVGQTEAIAQTRIAHATRYDAAFAEIPQIRLPPRPPGRRRVYHLYMIFAENRDELLATCQAAGIEAKIHYPIPLYQQVGLRSLGYRAGDFPVADRHAKEIITFPCDQHLSTAELDHVIETVRAFYSRAA